MKKILQFFSRYDRLYLGLWSLLFITIWKNMLVFDGTYYWTGWKNIAGDWTMHFQYIYNFLYRPFPLPYHPLYWGVPFRYHFAADALSALGLKFGLPLIPVIMLQSICFSILLVVTIYTFYRMIYEDRRVATIAMVLFLFNGGLGFIFHFLHLIKPSDIITPFSSILEFTHIESWNIHWINFITAEFIPQRPFLMGMPIAVFGFINLWKIYQNRRSGISRTQACFAGILIGLLPVIHIYSYVVVIGVALYLATLSAHSKTKGYLWAWFFIPLLCISACIFYFIIGLPVSYIQLQPGWLAPHGLWQFMWFWVKNIGVMVVFIPLSFFAVPKKIKVLSVPFTLLFILSNIFIFQPHSWDNRKFLLYWYFFSSGMVAYMLIKMYQRHHFLTFFLAIILFYTSIASGALDVANLYNFNHNKYRLFSIDDMRFAQAIRARTTPQSVFLTYPGNSWLSIVLGRQIIMGFEAWIDNLGINPKQREHDIQLIYEGDQQALALLKQYHVDYVIIGPNENRYSNINRHYFTQFPVLESMPDTIIYDVRTKR